MEQKSAFEVKIPRTVEAIEGSKPVIHYIIEIQKRASEKWEVEKRYKEFAALHETLKKIHPNIPPIPGKSLLKLKNPNDIESRREGLEKFICSIVSRQDTINNEAFKKFIQLDQFAPEASVHPPKLLADISGFEFGIRDFHYETSKGLLFLAQSDMKATSRLDSYLTNMKKPWEKEQKPAEAKSTIGFVECYIQKDPNEFRFEKLWSKSFHHQLIVLYWDHPSSLLIVGQDDGKVTILKVPSDLEYIKTHEVVSHKVHSKRVMGVYVDPDRTLVYTVSEDKKFKVFDYERTQIISEEIPGSGGLTALSVDRETKRAFIPSRGGEVYIYDLSTTSPKLIHTITAHPKGDIRGFLFEKSSNYMLTSNYNDGSIIMHNLYKPGKEKLGYPIATLKGKPKVRCVLWSSNRQEIYSGNQDGTVGFWRVKDTTPLLIIKAHDAAVCKMEWNESTSTLITGAKDCKLKFWKLPVEWRDKHVEEQEERHYRAMKESQSILKIQQQQQKAQEDSDEDDLAGWHE